MKVKTDSSNTILGLLGIAFIVLKLTGMINWSWWYVTMPFWIGLAIMIILIITITLISFFKDEE